MGRLQPVGGLVLHRADGGDLLSRLYRSQGARLRQGAAGQRACRGAGVVHGGDRGVCQDSQGGRQSAAAVGCCSACSDGFGAQGDDCRAGHPAADYPDGRPGGAGRCCRVCIEWPGADRPLDRQGQLRGVGQKSVRAGAAADICGAVCRRLDGKRRPGGHARQRQPRRDVGTFRRVRCGCRRAHRATHGWAGRVARDCWARGARSPRRQRHRTAWLGDLRRARLPIGCRWSPPPRWPPVAGLRRMFFVPQL